MRRIGPNSPRKVPTRATGKISQNSTRSSLAVGGAIGRTVRVVTVPLAGRYRLVPVGRSRRLTGLEDGVVHLEGGVGDAVLAAEERLEVGTDRMTVLARRHEHVRRGGGQARGDLPDVQVMDLGDVRAGRH